MSSKPMYFPPAPFDLAEAVECSDLVDLAYGMYYQWIQQGKPHTPANLHWQSPRNSPYRFGEPIWGNSEVLLFPDWEPFALVAQQDDKAYAIFRGTETLEDWYNDAEIKQVSYEVPHVSNVGLVHEGFFDLYKSLRQSLISQLNALEGIRTLYITGHSLGAALAMVSTPDLMANALTQHTPNVFQYNLAGPRACDPKLAIFLNTGLAQIYRIVNSCDLVPEVPPSVYLGFSEKVLYEHVGYPVTFTAQYGDVPGNHAHHTSYNYALKNPQQPQGTV
ncbi:MAG: lipase family protein [Nitrospira sp.]|nr:lipase family protein [Nitrospira sp.]MCA9457306.1 lipase family protein [Nitrospira sp.]HQU28028.1 lipase family protein [Nitrospirales bacterium]